MLNRIIRFFLDNKLVSILVLVVFVVWGIVTAPFPWNTGWLPRDPVPVDAIPDIGDNQQIIATEWIGRSPRDIENQITYPLSTALQGIPGVKTIRSTSMFGMSFIYIIFKDNIDYYWSRSRILGKLNSLPTGTLPAGIKPALGPDATALGQVYWYTLEGRDEKTGKPAGGWDPEELRTIQDFYVRYALSSADGVSEVASIGGYVKEYQVDINPEAMKSYGVSVMDIMNAVKKSNLDIGAETIEMNMVEYVIRGLGYIKNLGDLENAVVAVRNNIPVRIRDVADVTYGPATRRGGLDKGGAEAVGAVVVARYGSNPLAVINNVKQKIDEIAPGLPSKKLADGTVSKVTIVPFYDRTQLIRETIGTLQSALSHEILISIIVIIILVMNLRASVLVSGLLPVGVRIIFVENILRHLEMPENRNARGDRLKEIVFTSVSEVSGAIITALATTVVSFLPVFFLQAAEGKLFRPLAFTKTFALVASILLGIIVLPTLANIVFGIHIDRKKIRLTWNWILVGTGILLILLTGAWPALALTALGLNALFRDRWSEPFKRFPEFITIFITLLVAGYYLSIEWLPLGAGNSTLVNFLFVAAGIALVMSVLMFIVYRYERILRWCLRNKWKFLMIPLVTILFGILIWQGANRLFYPVTWGLGKMHIHLEKTGFWRSFSATFPGLGKEFMPFLDEGSFLLMPTTMPNTGIEQNIKDIRIIDKRLMTIPEIEMAVGKWGRANSALDPAPVQMFENTINYKPEYILDENGRRMRFKTDRQGKFLLRDGTTFDPGNGDLSSINRSMLIPDSHGDYFRQWRKQIHNPDDIWKEIVKVTTLPGLTSAPKLQPIQTRLIMLSTGMRAPLGVKVFGPDLESIEKAGLQLESVLKEVPSIVPASVFYDRTVGAPYIEIKLNRDAMARYGMTISDVQEVLQVAVGGIALTTTVEGRERFPVRVRYARELRSSPEELKAILIPAMNGAQIPLEEIASINYVKGPQMIRSEDTFLNGYVIFDKRNNAAEVNVVQQAQKFLRQKIASGELKLPPGVTYKFAGNFEQQVRAAKRLEILIPVSLIIILLILYFQFRTVTASFIHFSGVFVAFAGGFIMLWLYGQDWFMNFGVAGINMRDLFQMHTINLSIAVWVGFIALFGIATNDGVIMGTYIHKVFKEKNPTTVSGVREAVVTAGKKRVRPAMMTAAVAIIALLPVLTSTGKGSDIMVPMAIPAFGGMVIQVMTMFVVPIFQSIWREGTIRRNQKRHQDNG
jgi:Cu(I)/Ag(I) efflux system membrane protein CusA/SilA